MCMVMFCVRYAVGVSCHYNSTVIVVIVDHKELSSSVQIQFIERLAARSHDISPIFRRLRRAKKLFIDPFFSKKRGSAPAPWFFHLGHDFHTTYSNFETCVLLMY